MYLANLFGMFAETFRGLLYHCTKWWNLGLACCLFSSHGGSTGPGVLALVAFGFYFGSQLGPLESVEVSMDPCVGSACVCCSGDGGFVSHGVVKYLLWDHTRQHGSSQQQLSSQQQSAVASGISCSQRPTSRSSQQKQPEQQQPAATSWEPSANGQ